MNTMQSIAYYIYAVIMGAALAFIVTVFFLPTTDILWTAILPIGIIPLYVLYDEWRIMGKETGVRFTLAVFIAGLATVPVTIHAGSLGLIS